LSSSCLFDQKLGESIHTLVFTVKNAKIGKILFLDL
jgi:hypothetical protein